MESLKSENQTREWWNSVNPEPNSKKQKSQKYMNDFLKKLLKHEPIQCNYKLNKITAKLVKSSGKLEKFCLMPKFHFQIGNVYINAVLKYSNGGAQTNDIQKLIDYIILQNKCTTQNPDVVFINIFAGCLCSKYRPSIDYAIAQVDLNSRVFYGDMYELTKKYATNDEFKEMLNVAMK